MRVPALLTTPRTGAPGAVRPQGQDVLQPGPIEDVSSWESSWSSPSTPERSVEKVQGRADGPSVTRTEPAGPAGRAHPHRVPHCPTAGLLGGEEQQELSPGPRECHPEWLRGAHPSPPHLHHTVPLPLPQMFPIWEVTDRFSAKRGKRQPGSGKRGQEERRCLCCIPRNLLYPRARQLPCPAAPASDIPAAHGNPRGEMNPCLVKERRQKQPGHCSGICRDLGSLQACGGSSLPLTSCRGCAEAPDHSSPTCLVQEPCQELKGKWPKYNTAWEGRWGQRSWK